jgi:hypothetical protein
MPSPKQRGREGIVWSYNFLVRPYDPLRFARVIGRTAEAPPGGKKTGGGLGADPPRKFYGKFSKIWLTRCPEEARACAYVKLAFHPASEGHPQYFRYCLIIF